MSTAGQSRDPALQPPWWMHPWEECQPEGSGSVVTLDEILEMPVLPGPGSMSPSAVPNPYDLSGGGSPLAPGLGLAETLSWTTTTPRRQVDPVSSQSTFTPERAALGFPDAAS